MFYSTQFQALSGCYLPQKSTNFVLITCAGSVAAKYSTPFVSTSFSSSHIIPCLASSIKISWSQHSQRPVTEFISPSLWSNAFGFWLRTYCGKGCSIRSCCAKSLLVCARACASAFFYFPLLVGYILHPQLPKVCSSKRAASKVAL